jgi:hypothetical protein
MRRLYRSHDSLLVGSLRAVLAEQGVRCLVKNELLLGAAGDIPPLETWPELWVIDDRDLERARALVQALLESRIEGDPWHCPSCGEQLEPQFTACWRCAGPAPDSLLA